MNQKNASGRFQLQAILLFFMLSGVILASDLLAQTLEEALVSTYLSNPTLNAQRAELRATIELVAEAGEGWRPTLAIESEVQNNLLDIGDENDHFISSAAALVLEQNLYQGGETIADIRRTENLVMYKQAELVAVEQEVLLSATEVYADLANNIAILDLARENENRLKQQLDGTKKRTSLGELTHTDLAQAEARYAGSIAEREPAIGELEASKANYRSITDQEPVSLTSLEAFVLPITTEADALDLALDGNPAIKGKHYRFVATEADIGVSKAAIYPALDLRAELGYADEYGLNDDNDGDDEDEGAAAAIGFELRIPLYQVHPEKFTNILNRRDSLAESLVR